MDKLDDKQQVRVVVLDVVLWIIVENLGRFISLGSVFDNKMFVEFVIFGLVKCFEVYIKDGV